MIRTRLRTRLLVAGLSGLLTAAGALVGGAFLYVFVRPAVAMTLFSFRRLEGYEASPA